MHKSGKKIRTKWIYWYYVFNTKQTFFLKVHPLPSAPQPPHKHIIPIQLISVMQIVNENTSNKNLKWFTERLFFKWIAATFWSWLRLFPAASPKNISRLNVEKPDRTAGIAPNDADSPQKWRKSGKRHILQKRPFWRTLSTVNLRNVLF